jgi:hypothetical protein
VRVSLNFLADARGSALPRRRTGAAKMSQRAPNDIASGQNPHFIDHCGRSILYGSYYGRVENMVIESVLFFTFVVAAGAAIMKASAWHQGILYGPYLNRVD